MRLIIVIMLALAVGLAKAEEAPSPSFEGIPLPPGAALIKSKNILVMLVNVTDPIDKPSIPPKKDSRKVGVWVSFMPMDNAPSELTSLNIQLECNGERVLGPSVGEQQPFPALPVNIKVGGDAPFVLGTVAFDLAKGIQTKDCQVRYMLNRDEATDWVKISDIPKQ